MSFRRAALTWSDSFTTLAPVAKMLVPGTRLHGIAGADRVRVNTFHHQAVDRVADGFLVTARAEDGIVEGMEDPSRAFCLSVQWHPERRPDDRLTLDLFRAFTEAARGATAPQP